MATITPNKSAISAATLTLDWATSIATNAQRISTDIDLHSTNKIGVLALAFELGRVSASAFTKGPSVRLEVSLLASGNDAWYPIWTPQMAVGASISATTLNGAVSAGATTATLTSITNVVAGEYLYLGHTTTPANYELIRVKSISGSVVTFEEACTSAHDNGAAVTSQAERGCQSVDVSGFLRARVIVDNVGSGQSLFSRVSAARLDSYTSA